MQLVTIVTKKNEKFLRQPTTLFNFTKYNQKEIRELIKLMRRLMKANDGIGLSANQIGLNTRVFVAEANNKFYAIFNPRLVQVSKNLVFMEEGCLSVPERFGSVERPERVILAGEDANGRKIKIKAWGLLARVFQHEVDHLDGKLFVDKAKNIKKPEIKK